MPNQHPIKPFATVLCIWLSCLTIAQAQTKMARPPKNMRELAMMRAYYDKTVWKKEVMAQNYEKAFVQLWDKLIGSSNKIRTLAGARFDVLTIGDVAQSQTLDWNISHTKFSGRKQVVAADWPKLLSSYAKQGYEVVETEWHHSEFTPPTADQPARSVVSAVIYAKHDATKTRYAIKGNLRIVWQSKQDSTTKAFQPKSIDATGLTILSRKGGDVFEYKKSEPFRQDPSGKSSSPVTVHPIILQDLNGDHLPEVSVVGANRVYWNKGDWNFEPDKLVEFPTRYVNAAVYGDFNGDGKTDLFCAPKNGFPSLHLGDGDGKFTTPAREVKAFEKKLRNPVGVTAGDIDGDGDLDIFMGQNRVGYQTGDIPTPYYDAKDSFPSYLLINDGKGNFRDATSVAGLADKSRRRNFSSSFVDLDDDNDLDLLLTNDFHGNDLFLNNGDGSFKDVTKSFSPASIGHGMSHSFGDYNLDGQLDFILVAMSSTTARRLDKLQLGPSQFPKQNDSRKHMGYGNRLYLNSGGTPEKFEQAPFNADVARTGWSWGSTTFDFDRDGDPDIYVANGQTSGKTTRDYCTRYWCHDLYYPVQNLPKPVLNEFFQQLAPAFSGRSVSWNGYEHNALLMNVDGKGFINVGFLMNCGSVLDSRTTVSGDLDLDGKVDLIFEHLDAISGTSTLHFLKNNWQDDHHWIGFHLPRSAYGTKVKLKLSDGRQLLQHYVTGHSVWAQHPNTIHFGLGKSKVATAEITWPNGKTQVVNTPRLDGYTSVSPK